MVAVMVICVGACVVGWVSGCACVRACVCMFTCNVCKHLLLLAAQIYKPLEGTSQE